MIENRGELMGIKKICTKCKEEYYDGQRIGDFVVQNTCKMNFCMACGALLKEQSND